MRNDRVLTINDSEADAVVRSIVDPTVRNLVLLAVGTARTRLARRVEQSESLWEAGLPQQPFDMKFFASTLLTTFSDTDVLTRIINGASVAEATGWDV